MAVASGISPKQDLIVAELRRRLAENVYHDRLPTIRKLAAEFQVHPITMNKALQRLAREGLLQLRRRSGVRVLHARAQDMPHTVEIIFEGYTDLLAHPFWREIWGGLLSRFFQSGYRTILTMLKADPDTGLLSGANLSGASISGRVVLGISEKHFFRELEKTSVPFLVAGDPVADVKVPQVTLDFTQGIKDAVDYLWHKSCRRIAFVGPVRTLLDSATLHKFFSYRSAIQDYTALDPALIADARPVPGQAALALETILKKRVPDAVIAASDTQLPELQRVLKERRLAMPLLGCDGLNLPELPRIRPVISAPLKDCGKLAAEQLICAIEKKHTVRSARLSAVFSALNG